MNSTANILSAPVKPNNLSASARWLSGEGAGSWFQIEGKDNKTQYLITRFSPDGLIECKGIFVSSQKLDLLSEYELSYPSHCKAVTVIQGEKEIYFMATND
jgi:hypothetical protein